ncbi:MAG: leucine-rich repeat protein [Bacteroidaceae bacterium]|nr:leucine-rich repeat protein [Bacteroidaceae bacterium]
MKDIGIKGTLRVMLAGIAFLLGENAWSADTIHVATAGTLSSLMESAGRLVKLTGFINGTDVKFLRERINANKLTKLDLADVRIVSGGEAYNESYTTTNDVLGDYMFADCSKLTSITLPTTIVDIGRYAFSKTGITKVEIPDGVTHLGHASFADCGSLKTVVIGRRVSILNQAVFYNSSSITTVSVKPKTPPSLDAYIFTARPTIRVYSSVLEEYKASSWNQYGSIVGKLENYYPEETDSSDVVNNLAGNFFEDVACTELKAEYKAMSDEELTQSLTEAGMPSYMIPIALKLKNETWANYEKDFRIHDYNAYSDASYWNNKLKTTGGSFMGNPTGIYTTGSDPLYVFVNDDVPSGATLYMAGCAGNDLITNAKQGKMLKKGLNVVDGSPNALFYILYTADTQSMTKTLSEWPDMKIHIEGGIVNGYYDVARASNTDYKAILAKATHERFTVKGGQALFHFKTSTYRSVWPRTIDKSICWFDSLTVWEKELAGISESVASGKRAESPFYLTGGESYFPQYYNNPNFAVEGESTDGGFANSSWFRTMYNTSGCVQSSFDVSKTSTFDDWCAAHECGHNNQGPITVEGGTEVSNNLFSNYIRFHTGLVTTNGAPLSTIMDEYARHEPFFTRPLDSQMRMYWQLYLYYHLAQKNTSFYPTLFNALRDDPLERYQSNTGCLKFVRKVCEIVGEDLTDFFRVWGFFEPLTNYIVNDYGAHSMTVTQADIDNTLAEIAQYPTKNREILFIEDRADYVLTTGFLTTAGKKRRESEKVGQCGEVGQFTDYLPGACAPSEYTYLRADSLYALEGEGGLGFIALDANDNLKFVGNAKHFCIPTSIGDDFTLYSYDADGSLHEITRMPGGIEYVNNLTAGGLSAELTESAIKAVVTGKINGTDIKHLRKLISEGNLQSINLAGSQIVSGGVAYCQVDGQSYRTAANVMGAYAFDSFKTLVSISLPLTITSIGNRAFRFSGLRMIEIPDAVTSIGLEAFGGCERLTTVIIGSGVTSISQGVFYNSPVKHAYVKALTPPTLSDYIFNSNPTIHVYPSALEAYLASDWAKFGTIVGDLTDEMILGVEIPFEDIEVFPWEGLDGAIFDLFGRRVTNPKPGSIYIRNGKKFILR